MPSLTLRSLIKEGVPGVEAMRRLLIIRYGSVGAWAAKLGFTHVDHVYGTLNLRRTGNNVRDAFATEFGEPREYIDDLFAKAAAAELAKSA